MKLSDCKTYQDFEEWDTDRRDFCANCNHYTYHSECDMEKFAFWDSEKAKGYIKIK